jgi:hypothetical protein
MPVRSRKVGLLMVGELRFTAEPRAFGLGDDTAVVGALEDPVALVHVPTRAALNPSTR